MTLYFGTVALSEGVLTGPTSDDWSEANTWAEHKPARGTPRLQEIGRELGTRSLSFAFDETYCDPEAELGKLQSALASKSAEALVAASGPYTGKRYVVDSLKVSIKKTTPSGRVTRLEGSVELKESPQRSLLGLAQALARAVAPALAGASGVDVRR